MLKKSFNPLFNKVTDVSPSGAGKPPAAAAETAGGEEGGSEEEEGEGEEDPPEGETPPPADPAAPAAGASPVAPKLTAFDRTKLRAIGMGGVINQLEAAHQTIALRDGTIATLQGEVSRLNGELAASKKAVIAATNGRENQVSKGVQEKLTTLGVPEESAPSQSAIEDSPAAMLEKFHTLKGAEKTTFYRANKAQLKIAEASRLAESKS